MDAEGVGIVVLTYGGGGEHAPLLESLLAEGVAAGSILVVHNPVEPGEAAPTVPAGCRVLQAERNLGYAAGMNLGIAAQLERDLELILLLTHDARFRDGALEALLRTAREQARVRGARPGPGPLRHRRALLLRRADRLERQELPYPRAAAGPATTASCAATGSTGARS